MVKTAICGCSAYGSSRHVTQILSIMKLTVLFLTIGILNVSAKGLSQNITYTGEKVPLKQVLKTIEKQTGFLFLYPQSALQSSKPVTIRAKDLDVDQFLAQIFKSQPLDYTIKGRSVFVSPKERVEVKKLIIETETSPEPEIVYSPMRGRVVDEDGNALPGATVTGRNTKNVSVTDGSGMFNLDVKAGDVLVITHVGYQSQEIRVTPSQISSGYISITLSKVLSQLDEVQIIAYGTTTRRLSTSNISSVKGEDLAKSPVFNPLQALQGRVPGITIQSSSGLPGAYINVRIQGQNSISRGNNPLYIVDGVAYPSNNLKIHPSQLLSRGEAQSKSGIDNYGETIQPGSPLSYINLNDIESIDVLKDADATSIYGSRGANGVILITTKRGKTGPIKFDLNLQQGLGVVSKMMKLLNTQEYLEVRREAFRNSGIPIPDKNTDPDPSNADLTMWDENKYTDWQKELIGGTAKYTNLYASATGGTNNIQYLVAATYRRQTTVYPGDFANQGAGANMNLNLASENKKFKVDVSAQYFFDNSFLPRFDLTSHITRPPNAPDLRNPDGTLNWALLPDGITYSIYNPLSAVEQKDKTNTNNLISSANIGYEIIPGLEIKSSFGYNLLQNDGLSIQPITHFSPQEQSYSLRTTSVINAKTRTWQIEPQLTYIKTIAQGSLNVLFGTTFSENYLYSQRIIGSGGTTDLMLEDFSSHPFIRVQRAEASKYKYTAGFARINYVWRDRYVVNLTGRRDGSSRFGSANVFHDFGSIAGAWIFSKEGFNKSSLSFLSFGKIHGSYGTMGNDNIGNYSQLSLYGVNVHDIPYQSTISLSPTGLPNPFLQWEEIRKLSIGLDLGFFENRLLVNTIWYRNRSSNQLTNYSLPMTTGFFGIDKNLQAKIQNSGWEFNVRSVNIDGKNLKWTTDANLTIQRNKLLEFPGIETTPYQYSLIVGKPLDIVRYYHYLGVSPETGLYTFADEQGKPTYTPSDAAKTVYRSSFPSFTAGMTNTLSYKNFQLSFVLQIVKQYGLNLEQGNNPGVMMNQPAYVMNRWQKQGDKASIQKFSVTYQDQEGTAYGSYSGSDAGYGNASFVRMNNLTISWDFPETLVKNIYLKNARVFALGQNLFTLTPYKGFDPEQRSGSFYTALPSLRVVTFGLQLTF